LAFGSTFCFEAPKGHQLPPFDGSADGEAAAGVLEAVDVVLRDVDVLLLDVVVVFMVLVELEVVLMVLVMVMLVLVLLASVVSKGVSFEQSMRPQRSVQLFRHMSVQFDVPVGQPQAHRSLFESENDQAPIRVPTASAYVSARPSQPHWLQVRLPPSESDALYRGSL
jgi:hypothetical protein